MSFSIVPKNQETINAFHQIQLAPNDETPIVEMNEETSRNIDIIWASIQATFPRWRGNKDSRYPGLPVDRKEFWGFFAKNFNPAPPLPILKDFVGSSCGEGKTAIDLGCGNGTTTKLLLQRGWHVIAIDHSPSILSALATRNKTEVESGQLRLIEADVTAYTPSEPVDLVVAIDTFSYIDPLKFRETWSKVHDLFIKKNGSLIGTLFRAAPNPQEQQLMRMNLLKELGIWFLSDRRMVRPLLMKAGYEIKKCMYQEDERTTEEQMCIQFVAEKK